MTIDSDCLSLSEDKYACRYWKENIIVNNIVVNNVVDVIGDDNGSSGSQKLLRWSGKIGAALRLRSRSKSRNTTTSKTTMKTTTTVKKMMTNANAMETDLHIYY